jgi:RimJ/RimL family protein N-acetyltransferase
VLRTDGLVLRPWRAEDVEAVREAFHAPDIQRWHMRRLDDRDEALEWIQQWGDRWRASTDASWAISADQSCDAVGYVALRDLSPPQATAQVSYWVSPEARGNGFATRALDAVSTWAMRELGLHRLWLMHSTANLRSCKVAVRAEYQPEGTLRQHLRHADGWHDMHVHGRIST